MSIFSGSYRKSIRVAATAVLVMGYAFGTVALVSGTSSPAEAKKAKKQEPKKSNKGGHSNSRRRGGGGVFGFGLGEGFNIYIGR